MIALTHVLVATDFGEAADTALLYGRALATGFGASLDERVVRTALCPVLSVRPRAGIRTIQCFNGGRHDFAQEHPRCHRFQ
jgi:hypothetical protein